MPEVITFYSDPNGAVVPFLFADVGGALSRWGYRVLCVNFDADFRSVFAPPPAPRLEAGEFTAALVSGRVGAWREFVAAAKRRGEREACLDALDLAAGTNVD